LFVDTAISTNNHDGQQYQQTTVMVSHINKQPLWSAISTNNHDGQPYQQTTVMVSSINKQP
jgi:hypothetical protein